jgi:hypothetical protein
MRQADGDPTAIPSGMLGGNDEMAAAINPAEATQIAARRVAAGGELWPLTHHVVGPHQGIRLDRTENEVTLPAGENGWRKPGTFAAVAYVRVEPTKRQQLQEAGVPTTTELVAAAHMQNLVVGTPPLFISDASRLAPNALLRGLQADPANADNPAIMKADHAFVFGGQRFIGPAVEGAGIAIVPPEEGLKLYGINEADDPATGGKRLEVLNMEDGSVVEDIAHGARSAVGWLEVRPHSIAIFGVGTYMDSAEAGGRLVIDAVRPHQPTAPDPTSVQIRGYLGALASGELAATVTNVPVEAAAPVAPTPKAPNPAADTNVIDMVPHLGAAEEEASDDGWEGAFGVVPDKRRVWKR